MIDRDVARAALELFDVDELGLDTLDAKVLHTLIEKFGGGPVGITSLAAALSEEPDTIEDVSEPYLLQIGFLQRTPRGRKQRIGTVQPARPGIDPGTVVEHGAADGRARWTRPISSSRSSNDAWNSSAMLPT